jgi:hypothetical protein
VSETQIRKHNAERPSYFPYPLAMPGTWMYRAQLAKRVVVVFVVTHIVLYDWAAVYFLGTQNGLVRSHWNALLNGVLGVVIWALVRHFSRAGMESELTAISGWTLGANPYIGRRPTKERKGFGLHVYRLFNPNWLLTLLERIGFPTLRTYYQRDGYPTWLASLLTHLGLHPRTQREPETLFWWQWLLVLPALPFAGFIGYGLTIGIYFGVRALGQLLASRWGIHPSWDTSNYPTIIQGDVNSFKEQWQFTLAGIMATLFYAHLVFRAYTMELIKGFAKEFAAINRWAELNHHRILAWVFSAHTLYPDGFRAAWYEARVRVDLKVNVAGVFILIIVAILAVGLAPIGFYVLTKVATHKAPFFIKGFGS